MASTSGHQMSRGAEGTERTGERVGCGGESILGDCSLFEDIDGEGRSRRRCGACDDIVCPALRGGGPIGENVNLIRVEFETLVRRNEGRTADMFVDFVK